MGEPCGRSVVDPSQAEISYKIVVDPNYKRFSIEKYRKNAFFCVIYDSYLLDFRHLNASDQSSWQKEILSKSAESMECLLRDHEDRAILYETYNFESGRCRSCLTTSIHGFPVAISHMYYCELGDNFNGMIISDIEDRPILKKIYEIDSQTKEFSQLISEDWDMNDE